MLGSVAFDIPLGEPGSPVPPEVSRTNQSKVSKRMCFSPRSNFELNMAYNIREDPVPVLMSASSISSSRSVPEENDFFQAVEVDSNPASASAAAAGGPLSWLCAPLDLLPSCSAEPIKSPTQRQQQRKQEDFEEAFATSRLLPFLVNSCVAGTPCAKTPEPQWNGYLPLDPYPQQVYRYPCLKQKRKHQIPHDLNTSVPPDELLVCTLPYATLPTLMMMTFVSCLVLLCWVILSCLV